MVNRARRIAAKDAALFLKKKLRIKGNVSTAIILGTGWGDKITVEYPKHVSFEDVPGFSLLQKIEGHRRRFVYGKVEGKNVMVLQGRVHLNEDPGNPEIFKMVRLQVEVLMQLGVKNLILTCAAGALPGSAAKKDGVVIIEGFMSLFSPQMPLWAGEFRSPEDTLTIRLSQLAWSQRRHFIGETTTGVYAMVLGPNFEGRMKDKQALSDAGASIVGMSMIPEACVAALYPDVEVMGLAFITNGPSEVHSHEANVDEAKKFGEGLSKYLTQIVKVL